MANTVPARIIELCRLQAECCKIFGNPLRLLILECIGDEERTFQELLALTGVGKATLSQHTGSMRRHGALLARREQGRLVFALANPKILRALGLMREVLLERIEKEKRLAVKGFEQALPKGRKCVAAARGK